MDLLDAAAVRAAVDEVRPTAVYHLAGATHPGRSWNHVEATLATNVRGTHHLLEALRAAKVQASMLIPSSAMVYKPLEAPLAEDGPLVPPNPYGFSKLAQEQLALRAVRDGIDVRIARPFNHIGPRQDSSFVASDFARQIAEIEAGRRGPENVVGNLDARREMTDVRDTVRAYRLLMQYGRTGRPYNVSSGVAQPIRTLLEQLIARARVAIAVRTDPARLRPNDMPLLVGDPSRIASELGWRPSIPLEKTLHDVLEYWRRELTSKF